MLQPVRKLGQSTAILGVRVRRPELTGQGLGPESTDGPGHMVYQAVFRVGVQVQIVSA